MTPPFDNLWLRALLGFIVGAVIGSFANMLIYRLPRRLSIIRPRSQCPSCHATLGLPDLVPILSWLFLRGRCRRCHAEIGAHYLWIEIAFALGGAAAAAIIA